MAVEKLFRETPFNGYNRDDVKEYIKNSDIKLKQFEEECRENCVLLEDQLSSLKSMNEELNIKVSSLNSELSEKREEILRLSSELEKFKNNELEQLNIINRKNSEVEELKKRLEELEKKFADIESASVPSPDDFENSIRQYLVRATKLKEEVEAGCGFISKEELYKELSEKDAKIKSLEDQLEQEKKERLSCEDIKNNVEKIKDDAKSEAAKIISDAAGEASRLRLETAQYCEKLISDAKESERSIRGRIDALKASVASIIGSVSDCGKNN